MLALICIEELICYLQSLEFVGQMRILAGMKMKNRLGEGNFPWKKSTSILFFFKQTVGVDKIKVYKTDILHDI